MADPNGKPNIVRIELFMGMNINTNGNNTYKIYYDKDPMAMVEPNDYWREATEYVTFGFAKDELEAWAFAQKTLDIVYDKLKDK
jgi:hypothetical protein